MILVNDGMGGRRQYRWHDARGLTGLPCFNQSRGAIASPGSALGVVSGELRRALFSCHKASMLRRALIACLACFASASFAEAAPQRVVSINLCADQLLVALATPEQIAALSPLSRDRKLSYVAERAATLPVHRGTAEDIVKTGTDLVLVGPYDNRYLLSFIAEKGVPVLSLGHWTSLAQGRAEIRKLAAALGQSERGEALIAAIDRALEDTRNIAPPGRDVVMLHRRGYVSGSDGITAELATHLGLNDAAAKLGLSQGGFVPLEKLIATQPDFIVVSDGRAEAEDQGTALLQHPALNALYPREKRLVLPDRLTICGGPATPELIRRFGKQVRLKAGPQN